jgi:ABC-2 type transport system permease protein
MSVLDPAPRETTGPASATITRRYTRDVIASSAWQQSLSLQRDGRLRWYAATLMLLVLAVLASGWNARRTDERQRADAAAEDDRLWRSQGAADPHMASHFGRLIPKPVSPLMVFDPGLDRYLGTVARLESHVQHMPRQLPADRGTSLSAFPQLSGAYVLQTLLPLLVILAGFQLCAGDTARVLLRQELAAGAPAEALLRGRGRSLASAAVVFAVAPLVLTGGLAGMLGAGASGMLDLAVRLVLSSVGYAAYAVGWVALTVTVSARSRSARGALAALLGVWALLVLLLPRLSIDVAEFVRPTPTTVEFQTNVRRALEQGPNGHDPADVRFARFRDSVLAVFKVAEVSKLPVNWSGLTLMEGEREASVAAREQYDTLFERYAAQASLRRVFAMLSPLVALQPLSARLAGTDVWTHVDFAKQVERYRYGMVQQLNADLVLNGPPGDAAGSYRAGESLWAQVPIFAYEPQSTRSVVRGALPDLLSVICWAVAMLLGSTVATRHLSVSE